MTQLKKYIKTFCLNPGCQFVIRSPYPWEKITVGYEEDVSVEICHDNRCTEIYYNINRGITSLRSFIISLEEAFQGQLELNPSLKKGIGLCWAEYLYKKYWEPEKKEVLNKQHSTPLWIGRTYYLWEGGKKQSPTASWLYTYNGQLFLEVTPVYNWQDNGETLEEKTAAYKKFCADYKPIFVIPIDLNVAHELHQWLKKLEASAVQNCAKIIGQPIEP